MLILNYLDLTTKLTFSTSEHRHPTFYSSIFARYSYFTDLLFFSSFLIAGVISLFQVSLSLLLVFIFVFHLWILELFGSKHLSYQAFSFEDEVDRMVG